MNHNVTLAIVAIVAAMKLTAVAFAIPQQALAYRHHNNHNNHNNSIKVDQQINQLNNCTGAPQEKDHMGSATVPILNNINSLTIVPQQIFGYV